MKRRISMESIAQLRNVVSDVKYLAKEELTLPTITVTGTEKIHGENGCVCFSNPDGFWVQSRKQIITPEKDNRDCAKFVMEREKEWMQIINTLVESHEIDLDNEIISIFFEWAGKKVKKNSPFMEKEGAAVIFQHFKVSPIEPEYDTSGKEKGYRFYETLIDGEGVSNENIGIFNIMNFPIFKFDIDFERVDLAQNKIIKLVEETIEKDSPAAKALNAKNAIGEGMVVAFIYKDVMLRFKVKGDKHSKTKVKKLEQVDSTQVQRRVDFANHATPAWRLEQMWNELFEDNYKPTMNDFGNLIRIVLADIRKEESDILEEKGLTQKEVNPLISKIVRKWFVEQIN